MFSYSSDNEHFEGQYDTREEAIAVAETMYPRFWTGRNRLPVSPEEFWKAEDWLYQVSVTEEYSLEEAEEWDESTPNQRKELESLVRPIMLEWLERHNLTPKFWHIEDMKQHDLVLRGGSRESRKG